MPDHFALHCTLQISKPSVAKSLSTYRRFNNINQGVFNEDILHSPLSTVAASPVNEGCSRIIRGWMGRRHFFVLWGEGVLLTKCPRGGG